MGHYTIGKIQCFTPDDTDTCFYVEDNIRLADLLVKIKEKFGDDVNYNSVDIQPEYIHTHALTYDQYDASDYTKYLCVTLL